MVSHAKIPVRVPIVDFQREVDALTGNWVAHFNAMHYEGEWTVLALRCPGGRPDQIIPDQIQQAEYANTELLDACPGIQSWLRQFQCPLLSVRLLNLKKNSIIKEHRDHELAFEMGEARLHIPIFTNPSVEFYLNNVLLKMGEGECWYINANLPHSVSNLGGTDRIHLVMDCVVNDWLISLFERGERYFAQERPPGETRRIIQELRLQNTEISNRLANELESQLNAEI
jgi:hypothetical protein